MAQEAKKEDKALNANTSQTEKVTTNEFKQVKVTELTLHPKLAGLYGPSDPEETGLLFKNIEEKGILTPIKVNVANQVICGKRRWEIAKRLATFHNKDSFDTITVEVVDIADDEVLSYAISTNQQRTKTIVDMYNEINRLWEQFGSSQGKKNDVKIDTNLEIAKITGTKRSYVEKIRAIAKVDVALLHQMVEKKMSIDAGYQESKRLKLLNELRKEKYSFNSKEPVQKVLKEEVIKFLEQDNEEQANLVKADLIPPLDAYKYVTKGEIINSKEEKCDCPFCSSKIKVKTARDISKLTLEETEDLLNKLRNHKLLFSV